MAVCKVCSLGQITSALFKVGGQYGRNMQFLILLNLFASFFEHYRLLSEYKLIHLWKPIKIVTAIANLAITITVKIALVKTVLVVPAIVKL